MKEFLLAKGVSVPHLEGIYPCYEVLEREGYHSFAISLSLDTLCTLLDLFVEGLEEPCFFVLELPADQRQEEQLRSSEQDPFHTNVYYWDGLDREDLRELLDRYGPLLLGDGVSCFGVASHQNRDEVFVGRYKITNIFTADRARYAALLRALGIPEVEHIRTVWDNFTSDTPGETRLITQNGMTVYDLVEELEPMGLYLAEQREQ